MIDAVTDDVTRPPLDAPPPPVAHPALGWRLRSCVLALVLLSLLPAIVGAGYAAWRAVASSEQAAALRMGDTATSLARAVEGDLSSKAALVNALAAAPGARELTAVELQRWLSRGGVVADVRPFAEPQQVAPPGVAALALHTGHAVFSNLLQAAEARDAKVAIVAPFVRRGGEAQQVLTVLLSPQQLLSLAPNTQAGRPAQSLLVAVTDGQGLIVARSHRGERFIGHAAPDWAKLQAMGSDSGMFYAVSAEGDDIVLSFQKLQGTPGWTVVVAESLSSFNAHARDLALQMAAGGVVMLMLSCLLALWLTRQLVQPLQWLARQARQARLVDIGHAPPTLLRIKEFQSLTNSIVTAQTALREQAQSARRSAEALASSERRYRMLAQSGAVVLWRAQLPSGLIAASGWQALTGKPEASALGAAWFQQMHADDQPTLAAALRAWWHDRATSFDAECRLAVADGSWRWVRLTGCMVSAADELPIEWMGVVEDVNDKHQAQAQVAHLALHDPLTGLPNRRRFRAQLESAAQHARRGQQGALLCIDLDHFKRINDSFGHPVGDALLAAVSARLSALAREIDLVARLGGDEFAIVQSHVASADAAAHLAARVIESLGTPFEVHGHTLLIGASVGVVLIGPPTLDADALLRRADIALYRAKQGGRSSYVLFETEMDAASGACG